MRTIVIASGKGGTGKTTLSLNLAIALSKRNQRVILVDADIAMANLAIFLGMETCPITLHDVLSGEAKMRDALYDAQGKIKFVPSGLSIDTYTGVKVERLSTVLPDLSPFGDIMIIDSPAGISKDLTAALSSANEIILIMTPEPGALADALKIKIIADKMKKKFIGVVLNMVHGTKDEISKSEVETVLEIPVIGTIPHDTNIRKAALAQIPAIIKFPLSPASKAMDSIAGFILGETQVETTVKGESFISKLLSSLPFFGKKVNKND